MLNWGNSYAKLARDDQYRPKTPVRFVHNQPLVSAELIERVRAVEASVPDRQRFKSRPSSFLLKPICARCGGPNIRDFEASLQWRTTELRRHVAELEEQIAWAEQEEDRATDSLKEFRELLKQMSVKEPADQMNAVVERLEELKAERDKTEALLKSIREWVRRPDFNSLDFFCKMPDLSADQQREIVQLLTSELVAEIRVMSGEREPRQRTSVNVAVEVVFKEPSENV